MKKTLTLLSLALMLISCKQGETTNDKKQVKPQTLLETVDCSFFAPLDSLPTDEQVGWLRAHQNAACDPKNDECRLEKHTISESEFNKGVGDYWGNNPIVYTGFSLNELKATTTNRMYEEFITFKPNTTNIIDLGVDKDFGKQTAASYYSVPLFYSLENIYGLDGRVKFLFTKALINSNETVVFFISGTNHYFDLSVNPT